MRSCGIGWHGDSERRKVVAVRLGHEMDMQFCWFQDCKPVSEPLVLQLQHGDMYLMSEKAVGQDWHKRLPLTLRHAAGAAKFTSLAKFASSQNAASGASGGTKRKASAAL